MLLVIKQADIAREEEYFDRLEKEEGIETKKSSVTELRITVVCCKKVSINWVYSFTGLDYQLGHGSQEDNFSLMNEMPHPKCPIQLMWLDHHPLRTENGLKVPVNGYTHNQCC